MRDAVKLALRISHTYLDDDIDLKISVARAELIRAGVLESAANSDTLPLIKAAIIAYVQSEYAPDEKTREGYQKSFQYQAENLRKSIDYGYTEE